MKLLKSIGIFALVLCLMLPITAYAREVASLERKGTIHIKLQSNPSKTAVVGAELSLFKVGEVYVDDGFHFRYTEAFSALRQDINTGLEDPVKYMEQVTEYVYEKRLQPRISLKTDKNGEVSFTDLELGLYYVVQFKRVNGFTKIKPFLITVPQKNADETLTYEIDAMPKLSTVSDAGVDDGDGSISSGGNSGGSGTGQKGPGDGTTAAPDNGTGIGKPDSLSQHKLPQTGQLWWPIFVLVLLGMFFIGIGFHGRYRYKQPAKVWIEEEEWHEEV